MLVLTMLAGVAFTPDLYAAGISYIGPSNLAAFLETMPPYWEPDRKVMYRKVGDPQADKAYLDEVSPLLHADRIRVPLMLVHGANDPRVKKAEADQIVAAMKARKLPVTYLLYPDEGHGFARPQNRLSFYAVAEGFLHQCLGGQFEPIGRDFDGSSITVPEGAAIVPGLAEAMKERETRDARQ